MKKFITLTAVASLMFSCGSGDRGELLEGTQGKRWITEKPRKTLDYRKATGNGLYSRWIFHNG